MFAPGQYENSRPDGFPVMEVVAPDGSSEARRFVPLRRSELRGTVVGPLAALQLVQVFQYTHAECDLVLEALYRFPLPGDAAVTAVWVRFGEVEIRAELKERQQAEQEYEEAVQSGRQAALATRESPDVFTLRVAGIQPDQEVRVETSFVQLARTDGAGWSLRVPLTTAPRYVREDEAGSRYAEGQPLAIARDPGHRFSLNLRLPGGCEVESPTHHLTSTGDRGWTRLQLSEGEVVPDRDCVLCWREPGGVEPTARVFLSPDPAEDATYFLALVRSPEMPPTASRIAREVTLLVDHSGSMNGAKWQAADWAVQSFLRSLEPSDRFSLGLFHDSAEWYTTAPVAAEPAEIERAITFLLENRNSGGTNLGPALERALHAARAEGDPARHVLLITDAEVSDQARLFRLAEQELRRPDPRRISVLCIDAAPNSFLGQELAERGGGVARFLTSSPDAEDITTALEEILADWSSPVVSRMQLRISGHAEAAGRQTVPSGGVTHVELGDLPAGRALWVAGRIAGAREGCAIGLAGRGWSSEAELPCERVDLPALKALFGARKVLGLEYLIGSGYQEAALREELDRLGYEGEAALALKDCVGLVYAEAAREHIQNALRGLLVRESLRYGVASMETAFVAVRSEAGRPVDAAVPVANALPYGWSPAFGSPGVAAMVCGYVPSAGARYSLAAAPSPAAPRVRAKRSDSPGLLRKLFGLGSASAVSAAPPAADDQAAAEEEGGIILYRGTLEAGGTTRLFDGSAGQGDVPSSGLVTGLEIRWTGGAPDTIHLGAVLLLYLGDEITPAARVRVADLQKQGGIRPLNLRLTSGALVRLELTGGPPAGEGGPALEIRLHIQ